MENFKHVDKYRSTNIGCFRKFNVCVGHCGIYFRCHGTAVVFPAVSTICGRLRRGDAAVEFYRFSSFLYDCISRVMWRMDTVNVGLHESGGLAMCSILFTHNGDRKSRSKFIFIYIYCIYLWYCLETYIFLISSFEPKANWWAYSIGRHPLSVRRLSVSFFKWHLLWSREVDSFHILHIASICRGNE